MRLSVFIPTALAALSLMTAATAATYDYVFEAEFEGEQFDWVYDKTTGRDVPGIVDGGPYGLRGTFGHFGKGQQVRGRVMVKTDEIGNPADRIGTCTIGRMNCAQDFTDAVVQRFHPGTGEAEIGLYDPGLSELVFDFFGGSISYFMAYGGFESPQASAEGNYASFSVTAFSVTAFEPALPPGSVVPLPSGLPLLGAGVGALALFRRRRKVM